MGYLTDGHQTLITFALNGSVKLREKTVQPPGISGGGPVSQTTMRNSTWRTQTPKRLKSMTSMNVKVSYDAAVYNQIIAMVNQNQQITVTFADGATLAFYGWIDEFTPDDADEGNQPTATLKLEPSMLDGSGAESGPTSVTAPAAPTTTTSA
jgi:hypothetical protein